MPNLSRERMNVSKKEGQTDASTREGGWGLLLTWIPSLAVGASVVARDTLDEILQDLLVARLLALV